MGFFSNLLSRSKYQGILGGRQEDHLKVLENDISLLRLSTFYCLQKKHVATLGLEKASALAAAVVSTLILELPDDDRFQRFYDSNRGNISMEAAEVHKQEQLSGPSGCASYLYAAEILHSKMVKSSLIPDATRVWKSYEDLQQKAAALGIFVPSGNDLCGSNDAIKCIEAIHSFAMVFYYTNTWTGTSPALADAPVPSIDYNKILLPHDEPVPEMPNHPQSSHNRGEIPPLYTVVLDSSN